MIELSCALMVAGWIVVLAVWRPHTPAIWLPVVAMAAIHSVTAAANAVICLLLLADRSAAVALAVTSGVTGWVAWSYWNSRPTKRKRPSKVLARIRVAAGLPLVVEPVRGS